MADTFADPDVLAFYRQLPFNVRASVEDQARAVTGRNAVAAYPVLPPLLARQTRVLDVGCGPGWLANGIAYHYGSAVTAIDFNEVAIARAGAVAQRLGLAVTYEVADLFRYRPAHPFDVVTSIGVLHHTRDCMAGLRHLCRSCVAPGGHLLVGLYHRDGRRPFLDHFAALRSAGAGEAEMLAAYRELLPEPPSDETHLKSWFRDQVLHPHETQHTLSEVLAALGEEGFTLVATSINRFRPFRDLDELLAHESTMAETARDLLRRRRYYPGFFVVLAKRQPR